MVVDTGPYCRAQADVIAMQIKGRTDKYNGSMPDTVTPPFFIARVADQQCDAWTEQTLLSALEAGGIDWPSSCRNGTCRTCIGHLTDGQVRYQIVWPGLSAEEKAQGCVLPCVAFPASDLTLVQGSL